MKKLFFYLQAGLLMCFFLPARSQNITTVAGNGQFSYGGDGGMATGAAFNGPTGISIDRFGNVFVADANNNVVRKIDTLGRVFTVAGTGYGANMGFGGYTGDLGPANAAQLFIPQDIVRDSSGNIYIADGGNHVVRKVSNTGIITTIAGTGTAGNTGDGSPATNATLNFPFGVALDTAGNLYISDQTSAVIRMVNPAGIISTICGTGTPGFGGDNGPATAAQLNGPAFIFTTLPGDLLIADNMNHRIRRINKATGKIRTIVGTGVPGNSGDGGPDSVAQISAPEGITIDHSGNLYFTDMMANVIRKVTPGHIISTIAGTGTAGYSGDGGLAGTALLNGPCGIIADSSGNIYFTDHFSRVVRRISTGDTITTIAGTIDSFFCGDGGPALTAELDSPMAAVLDDTGNVYVADFSNNCIRLIHHGTGLITTFAGNPHVAPGFGGDGGPATAALISHPKGLARDAAGNMYFTDAGNACIRKVSTSGIISTIAGTPLSPGFGGDGGPALSAQIGDPNGIVVDGATGDIYFSDAGNKRVRVVHGSGSITTYAGTGVAGSLGDGGLASAAQLTYPMGLALDGSGNLYIADSGAARVRVVHGSGSIISTFAGTGIAGSAGDGGPATAAQLTAPMGVVVDDSGNVHIADGGAARIRVVHGSGSIITYAGTGVAGFNGDGPLASAQINKPVGLAMGDSGKVYITDCNNNRVRKFAGPGSVLRAMFGNKTASDDLSVYPNPGKGTFMMNFVSSSNAQVHYTVTNMMGQKVKDISTVAGTTELQLSVPAGVYLINATDGSTRKVARIVVEP